MVEPRERGRGGGEKEGARVRRDGDGERGGKERIRTPRNVRTHARTHSRMHALTHARIHACTHAHAHTQDARIRAKRLTSRIMCVCERTEQASSLHERFSFVLYNDDLARPTRPLSRHYFPLCSASFSLSLFSLFTQDDDNY